jgi:hypothetical protein
LQKASLIVPPLTGIRRTPRQSRDILHVGVASERLRIVFLPAKGSPWPPR